MISAHRQFIPFPADTHWVEIRDGDLFAFDIFTRHYTFNKAKPRDQMNGKRMTGPGEKILLVTHDGSALFAWRKEKFRRDNQQGANCAIFRNEGKLLSSELILQAERFAYKKWGAIRLYTFVNQRKIESSNPGYCFKCAGWIFAGFSKSRNLTILEKNPIPDSSSPSATPLPQS